MLVISRKSGESIRIGDEIVIRVTKLSGSKVSFAIDAPREIPITRSELLIGGASDEPRPVERPGNRFEACCP